MFLKCFMLAMGKVLARRAQVNFIFGALGVGRASKYVYWDEAGKKLFE